MSALIDYAMINKIMLNMGFEDTNPVIMEFLGPVSTEEVGRARFQVVFYRNMLSNKDGIFIPLFPTL